MDDDGRHSNQKDREQQRDFVARRLLAGGRHVRLCVPHSSLPDVLHARLQLQHLNADAGVECLRDEPRDPDRRLLDVARHHALRQLRAQDHLVSRGERSWPAHSRHSALLPADGTPARGAAGSPGFLALLYRA